MKHLKKFNESWDNNRYDKHSAFIFAEENWSSEILDQLLETEMDIESILSNVDNLGDYTIQEWVELFERIREEGI
jgi:hypothetical protein